MAPAAGAICNLRDLAPLRPLPSGRRYGARVRGRRPRLLSAAALAGMQAPLGPGGSFVYERLEAVGLTWHLGRVGGVRRGAAYRAGEPPVGAAAARPERAFAFCMLANAPAGATLYTTASHWALQEFLGLANPPDTYVTPPAARIGGLRRPLRHAGRGRGGVRGGRRGAACCASAPRIVPTRRRCAPRRWPSWTPRADRDRGTARRVPRRVRPRRRGPRRLAPLAGRCCRGWAAREQPRW